MRLPAEAAAGLLAALASASAQAASPAEIRDFLVQNVCLDAAGRVVEGVGPIDGDRRCVTQRDLRPGEPLPYHKHDQPAFAERSARPRGYQRHDSFPVATALFGNVVEHSFDFGVGEGRRFGVFDEGSDGGDIAIVSADAVSIAATEDGGGGFQLFVGPHCVGPIGAAAMSPSWIVAQFAPALPPAGETVARLADLHKDRQASCPSRLNAAFTRWYLRDFAYRAGPGQGPPVTLTTLVSEHYGGADPATAGHVERFYFTRELGSTRWERWQNVAKAGWFDSGRVERAAEALAGSGRCGVAPKPAGGAPLAMVDCREWTNLVPPDRAGGDRAGFFIDAIRSRGLAAGLFAAPVRD